MGKGCNKYRVILAYIGDNVPPKILDKICEMENDNRIKICAVIQPGENGFELSLIDGDENLIIDYVFLLSTKYQVGKNIIKQGINLFRMNA